MLLNISLDARPPSLELTVDPIAAARFAQVELSSQIAISLASRAQRLEQHFNTLARALVVGDAMLGLEKPKSSPLPPITVLDSPAALDQFLQQDRLLLAPTRTESDALAEIMTEVGLQPPPVMYPVMTTYEVFIRDAAGHESHFPEAVNSFAWVSATEAEPVRAASTDQADGTHSSVTTTFFPIGDQTYELRVTSYLFDSRANRRFTEASLDATRGQIAAALEKLVPELQRSSAVVATQTTALNYLVLENQRTHTALVKREDRLKEGRAAEDDRRRQDDVRARE